jgi:maltooligosyltrehalose trehalohydrolase
MSLSTSLYTSGPGKSKPGATVALNEQASWRVWAPCAQKVTLVLIDGERRRRLRMTPVEDGYFAQTEENITEGQRYAFVLDDGPERPDPASLWQPDGVSTPSAVLRTADFHWTDGNWQGIARHDLVFYELHVGAFTPEGTFQAVIPRLRALRDLGVTAIEVMPVAQFSGTRNWGYDGVQLYAPQNSYGGPHGLQKLVDACHGVGLAVFLDVVYNHVGPEGNYLREFGPYFTDHYKTPWGHAVNYDGRGSDGVRRFILDNARMWIEDYHFDGLRLDAVHAIYDFSAHHILQAIAETVRFAARGRDYPAYVIAESDLNDPRLVRAPEQCGYGLDAHWSDDFHHAVHAYLTGESQGYYEDFGDADLFPKLLEETFIFDGRYSRHRGRSHGAPAGKLSGDHFVVCIQNHDQVGNRARGERLGHLISPAAKRLAASLLLLAPHLPLLFMGEEYDEARPFQFFCSFTDPELVNNVRVGRRKEFAAFHDGGEVPDPQAEETFAASRLSWSWEDQPEKAALRKLYSDLLSARRACAALRDFNERAARMLTGNVLELLRGGRTAGSHEALQIFFNLTNENRNFPHPLNKALLWSSEWTRYRGRRHSGSLPEDLSPYEVAVFGAAGEKSFLG